MTISGFQGELLVQILEFPIHFHFSLSSIGRSQPALGDLFVLFDLGLTSLSTFFSHIATVSGCGRELNAHF